MYLHVYYGLEGALFACRRKQFRRAKGSVRAGLVVRALIAEMSCFAALCLAQELHQSFLQRWETYCGDVPLRWYRAALANCTTDPAVGKSWLCCGEELALVERNQE